MKSSGSSFRSLVQRAWFPDACALLVVFLAGLVIGAAYVRSFQLKYTEDYGQREFGAAVAFTCGHGFTDPRGDSPALAAFLAKTSDRLSCGELTSTLRYIEPNFTQRLYRYLMLAVGLTWKVTGVSWSALAPLFGVLFAVTLCVAYGLFRLAAGPPLAFAGVLPLAVSAHHLALLPSLRDYAKAPFMLLPMLVMAWLAVPPFSWRRAMALSCLFGVVLGVGFGFRNDVLIHVPAFVAVVALLLPVGWREQFRLKAACVAVAALMFVVSAWPILRAYGQGSNTGHVAVLGLMTPFDAPMSLTRPPYDIGTLYNDRYAGAIIGTRAFLRTGKFAAYLSPEYDREAVGIVLGVARHWPADIFVRALGSTLAIFDLPFTVSRFSEPIPLGVRGTSAEALYPWRGTIVSFLGGLGPLLVLGAVIAIGSISPRNAIVLFVLLLYYCGYPAIQFDIRHFFHLEFVGWLALLFVLTALARSVVARVRRAPWRLPLRSRATGAVATIAATALIIFAPLWTLRAYQQVHVPSLIDELHRAPWRPATLVRRVDREGAHIVLTGLWDSLVPGEVAVRYLAAEFSAQKCRADDVPVRLKYVTQRNLDYSSLRRIPIDAAASTEFFAPVYRDADWTEFSELQMPAAFESCLKSVSVLDSIGGLPVPIDLVLTPRLHETAWFQRLVQWESGESSPVPVAQSVPPDLASERHPEVIEPPLRPDYVAKGLSTSGRGWKGTATAYVPQSRLLQFGERDLPEGAVLRATGVLRRGGVQIGVLKDDHWMAMRSVETAGPFTVLVAVPQAGRYGVLVTDWSAREWQLNYGSLLHRVGFALPRLLQDDVDIQSIAWTRPIP